VSANQRPLADARVNGLGTFWPAADRARRIRSRLEAGPAAPASAWDEKAAAEIQLDTLVPRLQRWRDVAMRSLDSDPATPGTAAKPGEVPVATVRTRLAAWDGHADLDSEAVELLDAFRRACARSFREAIAAAGFPSIRDLPFPDLVALRLAESRPAHFLPPPSTDWDAFLRERLLAAANGIDRNGQARPWGEANRLAIVHPLAANPLLGMRLKAPADPQPGHPLAVRVAAPSFGASQRMVVAPGRESSGLFAMPLGQSGDPLDGHFLDHHPSWIEGNAGPFLAGPAVRTRSFRPAD
jgi:penicillin amidase